MLDSEMEVNVNAGDNDFEAPVAVEGSQLKILNGKKFRLI